MTERLTIVLDRSRKVAGHLLRHAKGWSAFDANDRLIGQSYSTPDAALSALRSIEPAFDVNDFNEQDCLYAHL